MLSFRREMKGAEETRETDLGSFIHTYGMRIHFIKSHATTEGKNTFSAKKGDTKITASLPTLPFPCAVVVAEATNLSMHIKKTNICAPPFTSASIILEDSYRNVIYGGLKTGSSEQLDEIKGDILADGIHFPRFGLNATSSRVYQKNLISFTQTVGFLNFCIKLEIGTTSMEIRLPPFWSVSKIPARPNELQALQKLASEHQDAHAGKIMVSENRRRGKSKLGNENQQNRIVPITERKPSPFNKKATIDADMTDYVVESGSFRMIHHSSDTSEHVPTFPHSPVRFPREKGSSQAAYDLIIPYSLEHEGETKSHIRCVDAPSVHVLKDIKHDDKFSIAYICAQGKKLDESDDTPLGGY